MPETELPNPDQPGPAPITLMERMLEAERRLAVLERHVLGRPCGYDVHKLRVP
jgi:hypothetical protein